jgi:hypothetical protein
MLRPVHHWHPGAPPLRFQAVDSLLMQRFSGCCVPLRRCCCVVWTTAVEAGPSFLFFARWVSGIRLGAGGLGSWVPTLQTTKGGGSLSREGVGQPTSVDPSANLSFPHLGSNQLGQSTHQALIVDRGISAFTWVADAAQLTATFADAPYQRIQVDSKYAQFLH